MYTVKLIVETFLVNVANYSSNATSLAEGVLKPSTNVNTYNYFMHDVPVGDQIKFVVRRS